MTDAVRAVDAAAGRDAVDPARIAVAGMSQGGGGHHQFVQLPWLAEHRRG